MGNMLARAMAAMAAAIGRYQTATGQQIGGNARFQPHAPRISQAKRRLNERRRA